MALVTEAEVRNIVTTSLSSASVQTAIEVADGITSSDLATKGLSATRLKHVQLYLAAHFVAVSDPQARADSESAGDMRISYGDIRGMGLDGTPYGQQAAMLDTSNTLRGLSRSGKMTFVNFKATNN